MWNAPTKALGLLDRLGDGDALGRHSPPWRRRSGGIFPCPGLGHSSCLLLYPGGSRQDLVSSIALLLTSSSPCLLGGMRLHSSMFLPPMGLPSPTGRWRGLGSLAN